MHKICASVLDAYNEKDNPSVFSGRVAGEAGGHGYIRSMMLPRPSGRTSVRPYIEAGYDMLCYIYYICILFSPTFSVCWELSTLKSVEKRHNPEIVDSTFNFYHNFSHFLLSLGIEQIFANIYNCC